jgi:hypothetical protein
MRAGHCLRWRGREINTVDSLLFAVAVVFFSGEDMIARALRLKMSLSAVMSEDD